ncbi:MAG TPA: c-type cytochrome [Pseudolabrys sp.]|jgi:mono/diheme cytochrome c family protein|nr:c-type cytochrome [Pseudolabrys sp.]
MRNAAAIALSLCAAGAVMVAGARASDQDFTSVERGRYLATAADCVACHTIPGSKDAFAGGRPIETPFGNIVSANITSDQATGIGSWTDEQFDRAVRDGIRPDGSRLYPAMPYPNYTKMSRDDVRAIRAYLRTVEPVNNAVNRSTLPFPFNIRTAMRGWNMLFFDKGEFKPDPTKSIEWNRGAYLVDGPGHCGACHTPKNVLGGDKTGEYLQGGPLQGWFAPNITNDEAKGLGKWSVDDIVAYLKTGHNRITAATGPMAEEIEHASSKMTDGDLKAMATYLKSVPGGTSEPKPIAENDPAMKAGHAIYRDQCAACHMIDGKGVASLFPSLADASVLRSRDPATAIRLVLRGARTVQTDHEPTGPGMPAYGRMLKDDEIAAVLTYARNAWGRGAPPVTADDVAKARKDLQARND